MKLILTAGWIVTLVAAFVVGRSMLPGETAETVTGSLSDALGSNDYLARLHGIAQVLMGLGPENIDENLAVFEKNYSKLGDIEHRAFMIAWTRFDPEAALAWADRARGRMRAKFVRFAIWAWAVDDPQGAHEAFEAFPSGKRDEMDLRTELVKGWIRGGGSKGATEFVISAGGGRQNSMLINKMAGWIASTEGIESVIEWAEDIPNEGDTAWAREAAFRAAISVVAKVDGLRAAEWYEDNKESEDAGVVLKALAFAWVANDDPPALFDWLQEQPEGQLRLETIRQAYRRWIKSDPRFAIAWLSGVTLTPALDPAVAIYARLESRADPVKAIEWASRIQDQNLQRVTTVPILRIWGQEDPAAARKWMMDQHYPESVRNDIVGRLSREAAEMREETDAATEAATTAP
jgi:hypothetical protein